MISKPPEVFKRCPSQVSSYSSVSVCLMPPFSENSIEVIQAKRPGYRKVPFSRTCPPPGCHKQACVYQIHRITGMKFERKLHGFQIQQTAYFSFPSPHMIKRFWFRLKCLFTITHDTIFYFISIIVLGRSRMADHGNRGRDFLTMKIRYR